MTYTRREIGQLALTVIPAARILGAGAVFAQAKPNSKVNGVQIGLNVPYSFGGRNMEADELLKKCLDMGVSALELRSQPIETFMGAPKELVDGRGTDPAVMEALTKWRTSASMDQAKAFRKKYNDAGVLIEIVKYDGIYNMSDAEVDYCFNLARTLGARAISCEIDAKHTQRIGQFADKHTLPVAYHGHAGTKPADWEAAFKQARYNWANLDLGHFVAGNNTSPVPFLKQHHARISHVHVKDRKLNEGAVTPFGEGDTPIVEALRVIRDNKWPIQATIEFEYPLPAGSDRTAEIAKTIEYCRKALLS